MTAGGADPVRAEISSGLPRSAQILAWLEVEGRLDVADAAVRLGVAQETVRRDLRALEQEHKLQRVHGGAVTAPPSGAAVATGSAVPVDDELADAMRALWAELPRSGTLLIGAGRLTPALAHVILADPPATEGLTVVTNHLDVAVLLSRVPRLSVYSVGGSVRGGDHGQEGDWALTELARLHTDVAVLCPDGVSVAAGLTLASPAAAAVFRAQLDSTRSVLVLADAESLDRTAFVAAGRLDEIERLLVVGPVDPAVLRGLAERGVSMTVTAGPDRIPGPPGPAV